MPQSKVYIVKVAFVHDSLSYDVDGKYELSDEIVASLPEGTVVEFVDETNPATPAPTPEPVSTPKVEPAKPWAGNHTVPR